MTWRFCSGSVTPARAARNSSRGVFDEEGAGAQRREVRAHEFGFAFAHQAGVDVGAVNALRAQRAQAQRVGDGRIDAAADEEEDVAAAGDLRGCVLRARAPGRPGPSP